jgi:hypothetical protein
LSRTDPPAPVLAFDGLERIAGELTALAAG